MSTYRRLAAPVRATFMAAADFMRAYENDAALLPGAFCLGDDWLRYCCPCGCGGVGKIRIGLRGKSMLRPYWEWNGLTDAITLWPSVHHVEHWHGWLTDGYWRQA